MPACGTHKGTGLVFPCYVLVVRTTSTAKGDRKDLCAIIICCSRARTHLTTSVRRVIAAVVVDFRQTQRGSTKVNVCCSLLVCLVVKLY